MELSLREGEPEEYLQLVEAGELDLALGFAYDNTPRLRVEACEEQTLMIDPIGIALPEGHPLGQAGTLSVADLSGEAFVGSTPESSMHDFTRNTCLRAGFEPTVNFETNDYHVAQALKHAHATHIRLELSASAGELLLRVIDDGAGGADPAGSGLSGLRERVRAVDGEFSVRSVAGAGTAVQARLPLSST